MSDHPMLKYLTKFHSSRLQGYVSSKNKQRRATSDCITTTCNRQLSNTLGACSKIFNSIHHVCASPSNQYPHTCPIYNFCADQKKWRNDKVMPKLTKLYIVTQKIIAEHMYTRNQLPNTTLNFGFITILVMSIFLKSWKLCNDIVCWWQMSYSHKFWLFLSKFRWSLSPSKLEGPHEVILGDFLFLHWASNMCTNSFSKSIWLSYAQPSPCPKGTKNPTQIGHHMWKILASKFGSYIWATLGTTSQNKECQSNIKFYMLGIWGFYMLFWPTW